MGAEGCLSTLETLLAAGCGTASVAGLVAVATTRRPPERHLLPRAPHLVCRHRKVWMGRGMPRPPSCSWPSELFLFTMMVAPGSPTAEPSAGSSPAAAASSSRCSPQLSSPPSPRQRRLSSPPAPGSRPFPQPSPRAEHGWWRRGGPEERRGAEGGARSRRPARRPRALLSAPPTVDSGPRGAAQPRSRAGGRGCSCGVAAGVHAPHGTGTPVPHAASSAPRVLLAPLGVHPSSVPCPASQPLRPKEGLSTSGEEELWRAAELWHHSHLLQRGQQSISGLARRQGGIARKWNQGRRLAWQVGGNWEVFLCENLFLLITAKKSPGLDLLKQGGTNYPAVGFR